MLAMVGVFGVLAYSVQQRFGVQPGDPMTFASVGVVLVLTAVVACTVPALRAIRVDPVEAFRNE